MITISQKVSAETHCNTINTVTDSFPFLPENFRITELHHFYQPSLPLMTILEIDCISAIRRIWSIKLLIHVHIYNFLWTMYLVLCKDCAVMTPCIIVSYYFSSVIITNAGSPPLYKSDFHRTVTFTAPCIQSISCYILILVWWYNRISI